MNPLSLLEYFHIIYSQKGAFQVRTTKNLSSTFLLIQELDAQPETKVLGVFDRVEKTFHWSLPEQEKSAYQSGVTKLMNQLNLFSPMMGYSLKN